jgi:Tol biopolymer transport system component
MVYVPSGQERIMANNLANTAEKQVSPADLTDSYAYGPAISPDGEQVAYFTSPLREDPSPASQLYVTSLSGGDPLALGDFVQGGDLAWSADGQHLLLASGKYYENRQLVILSLQGETRTLVKGAFPSWQPRLQ